MVVLKDESTLVRLKPDIAKIMNIPVRGVIVTAPGDITDFVSRFFAPQAGIPEDPVTGSAHTTLTPYWAKRLAKPVLTAIQRSSRVGHLWCEDQGDRVKIGGHAFTYLIGEIEV